MQYLQQIVDSYFQQEGDKTLYFPSSKKPGLIIDTPERERKLRSYLAFRNSIVFSTLYWSLFNVIAAFAWFTVYEAWAFWREKQLIKGLAVTTIYKTEVKVPSLVRIAARVGSRWVALGFAIVFLIASGMFWFGLCIAIPEAKFPLNFDEFMGICLMAVMLTFFIVLIDVYWRTFVFMSGYGTKSFVEIMAGWIKFRPIALILSLVAIVFSLFTSLIALMGLYTPAENNAGFFNMLFCSSAIVGWFISCIFIKTFFALKKMKHDLV